MAQSVHLTSRCITLFADVGEHGILDRDDICARHFAGLSMRRCQQRLQAYCEHGLLRALPLSVWYAGKQGGRVPTVYGLTERGGAAVEQARGERPRRILRSDPKPETLHHRLAVVRARLVFDEGCRFSALQVPTWIMEQDRRRDARPNEPPSRQRVLFHEFNDGGKKVTCQPDGACAIEVPRTIGRPEEGTTPLLIFWEVDRSTERTGQVLAKCPGYAALISRQEYRRYFPGSAGAAVRVFFVCPSLERVRSLASALKEHSVGPYLRFGAMPDLTPQAIMTAPVWTTVDGDRRTIMRPTVSDSAMILAGAGQRGPHLPPHRA